jgi:hypothetical protein
MMWSTYEFALLEQKKAVLLGKDPNTRSRHDLR